VGIGWIWEKRTGDSDTGQAAELVLALGYRWRRTQWTWTDAEEGDVHQVNATRYSRPIYTLVLWFILNRNFLQWLLYTETIAVTWKVILHCTTLTFWRCVASNITFFFIFAVLVVWYMHSRHYTSLKTFMFLPFSLIMTPSTLSVVTRSMLGHGGGNRDNLPRSPRTRTVKINSFDFARFSLRLLVAAHDLNVWYLHVARAWIDRRHYEIGVIRILEQTIRCVERTQISCSDNVWCGAKRGSLYNDFSDCRALSSESGAVVVFSEMLLIQLYALSGICSRAISPIWE